MALRLHPVSDEEWQRLVATRRNQDLAAAPPRASINAIETELTSLGSANSPSSD
ncbi:MAG: hypothetical protein QOG65_2941 [Actinomycetota bacterium]|jgi:hypothetical protein|nr:hypothetical protein [Actinomycetota bacterium]MDQ1385562.1 hypothetical protein [Actinomycetota bacterium]